MAKNILKDKSYAFALKIVEVYRNLQMEKEFVLSKQVLRSGTSIGALINEAEFGYSKADFTYKMSLALKEANETQYWLTLLKDSGYISNELFTNLLAPIKEIIALLVASLKTAKRNITKR